MYICTFLGKPEPGQDPSKAKGKQAEDAEEAETWERVPILFFPDYILYELAFVGTEWGEAKFVNDQSPKN